jgi:hypothetical protein
VTEGKEFSDAATKSKAYLMPGHDLAEKEPGWWLRYWWY